MACAGLEPEDAAVEVGPGAGALTRFILPKVRELHLIEIDRDLADQLERSLPPAPCRISIHRRDMLDFDFVSLSENIGKPLILIGNLPYNISSPFIFRLLECRRHIKRAVVMVQKEVGERLCADPGSKIYGVLSVLLGIYSRTKELFPVGPAQFYPPPKVDSLVVSIDFTNPPYPSAPPLELVRSLVNASFQKRRKTLRNSLKEFAAKKGESVETVLIKAGIDFMRRPETLSPAEFITLAGLF